MLAIYSAAARGATRISDLQSRMSVCATPVALWSVHAVVRATPTVLTSNLRRVTHGCQTANYVDDIHHTCLRKIILRDYDLLFEVKIFETSASVKRWDLAQNTSNDFDRFWYLPTNDTVTKVFPVILNYLFQGKKFEMLISLKHWELAQKC